MRFDPGKSDVDRELRVVNSRAFDVLRPSVIALVAQMHRARTAAEFVEVHRGLFEQFLRFQLAQTKLRGELADGKKARHALVCVRPRPIDAIREANASIDADELLDHTLGCALHALRCVGDGLAWAVYDFDRAAISVHGHGRRVGRLASGTGLQAELAELDSFWHGEGRFALHNDLTNCLRYGDLTLPPPRSGPTAPEIVEIKASGKHKVAQTARLAERQEFLRTGFRAPAGDDPGQRILPPRPLLRTFNAQLRPAIRRAREDGIANFSPHRCMTVAVADHRRLDEVPERAEDWTGTAPRARGWEPADPRVIQLSSFVRRLREQDDSFAFVAPYAIFPLHPVNIADLLLGRLEICATISCDELEATLAEAGLKSLVAGGADANRFFLQASDDANTVTLPPVIREQMLTELMVPGTLVAAIRQSLAATALDTAARPARHLISYAGESYVWRTRQPPCAA